MGDSDKRPVNSSLLAFLSDGSNVLKSFIGSNYLVMPFAFAQSGLWLGSIGLVVIAYLTDRCCSTLIRCKHRAVEKLHEQRPHEKTVDELHAQVSYGDTARLAYGDRAESVIDAALAFTQFGFCIEYFVFVLTALKVFIPSASRLLLALVPLAVLAPCALVPNVASLGPISMLANLAILMGFVGCLAYDAATFEGSLMDALEDAPKANWRKFPVFFSVVMSCFEGIGTVLPVESSMASGRQNYPSLLHGVIAFTAFFLGTFGIAGLLRYGADGVEQIATENLSSGSFVGAAVRGCLLIAILFTYPLQVFPVLQCGERWVFNRSGGGSNMTSEVNALHKNGDGVGEASEGPSSPLMDGQEPSLGIASSTLARDSSHGSQKSVGEHHNYVSVAGRGAVFDACLSRALTFFGARIVTEDEVQGQVRASSREGENLYFDAIELYGPWAGVNLKNTIMLRFGIVLGTAGVALVAADFFGYIASVVGAVGATTLSFIMPSLLHLKLFRGELSFTTRSIDVFIACLGVVSGVVGLVVTIQDWVKAAT